MTIRRTLLALITARAAVISALLGSAILIQIKSPGTLPVDPFFFLLGLTFALTVVYSLTIRQAERHRCEGDHHPRPSGPTAWDPADLSTTQRYVHVRPAAVESAIRFLTQR